MQVLFHLDLQHHFVHLSTYNPHERNENIQTSEATILIQSFTNLEILNYPS